MRKIIYSKYSNERSDKFKIRTDILEDDQGQRFVKKTPLTQEAQKHMNNMYNSYKLLSELYKDSNIYICKCYKKQMGLEFEYIRGVTLEETLDELLFKKKYEVFFEKLRYIIDSLGSVIVNKHFESTDKFEKVFGKIQLPKELKAADINNIDFIFSNIIVGKNLQIIDYEWTFDFPVPFNYIIYRAIYYYVNGLDARKGVIDLGVYKLLGITDQEIIQYENMEQNFQSFVQGDLLPLSYISTTFLKERIDVNDIVRFLDSRNHINIIQIFYDYGEGFSESNSYKIQPSLINNHIFEFEIPITENVKQVRIDPSNTMCIVKLNSISGNNRDNYKLERYTNGMSITEEVVIFSTYDPQIVLKDIRNNTIKLDVSLEIQEISEDISIQICNNKRYFC